MLQNQKEKFSIPDNISYLNCAFMSPLLKTSEAAGHQGISLKSTPYKITGNDFFEHTNKAKTLFANLISADDFNNIAIVPAVSYGIATVANAITISAGEDIIVVEEQFPSNIYSWQKIVKEKKANLKIIAAPKTQKNKGKQWNEAILNAINHNTKVVAIPHVHWSDGTLFDLKAIREKTKKFQALLIIDGTQSVGALPFSIKELQVDALICASYKWLFGHYSIGFAYYSDALCQGLPIEENWINRKDSENFQNLVNYQENYQVKAGRFNVGEMSNFALTPVVISALEQLLEWQPKNIQNYSDTISKNAIAELRAIGCFIEADAYRSKHLFGVYLAKNMDVEKLKKALDEQQVFVSFRGAAIRVSVHLFNTAADLEKLVWCIKQSVV